MILKLDKEWTFHVLTYLEYVSVLSISYAAVSFEGRVVHHNWVNYLLKEYPVIIKNSTYDKGLPALFDYFGCSHSF